jgi:hypothetical protein
VGGDGVALVADDDGEPLRVDPARGGEGVPEEASSADAVEHLGGAGLHPGALTCGEDDDSSRTGQAHAGSL